MSEPAEVPIPTSATPATEAAANYAPESDAALTAMRRRKRIERVFSVFSPLLLILLWEIVARVELIDVRFFPAPSRIGQTFVQMLVSGDYFKALGLSLGRIGIGFLLGAVPGVVIGIIMGLSSIVRSILGPIVGALLPIPKLALLPLILLVFGIGEPSKWVTIASGVFFYVLYDTVVGVINIDNIYLDVARNYGATPRDFFFRVALPGALPLVFNGFKLGLSVGLLLIVAAEMIGANSGIGYMIWSGYSVFALERMYVGLMTMAFLGYVINQGMDELEKVVVPWKH